MPPKWTSTIKAFNHIYAADLTEEYVDFNKGDVGDPASMGG